MTDGDFFLLLFDLNIKRGTAKSGYKHTLGSALSKKIRIILRMQTDSVHVRCIWRELLNGVEMFAVDWEQLKQPVQALTAPCDLRPVPMWMHYS